MSDPIGTSGAAKAQSDLEVAIGGGRRFMDRLQQLADATGAHEDAADRHTQALKELNLGQTATDALASAQAKLIEADHVLTDARKRAADIEQKSIATAVLVGKQALKEAEAKVAEAQEQATKLTEEALGQMSEAQAANVEMQARLEEVNVTRAELERRVHDADDRSKDVTFQKEHAQRMLAKLVDLRNHIDTVLKGMG